MSRETLVAMAQRTLTHAKAGTVPQAESVTEVPSINYYDPDRWRLEMDQIFRRLPLILGFSCELSEAGAYRAIEVAGVPLLLIRGSDGIVRSFVNMCLSLIHI